MGEAKILLFAKLKMPNESNLQTINNILSVNTTDCIYTKCYCEENIWKLCERVQKDKPDLIKHCFAIFVSNPRRSVPLWCQKASRGDPWQDPVIWDYHVFLVYHVGGTKNSLVYDLDTVLPFPESFESYFNSTFRNDNELQQKHRLSVNDYSFPMAIIVLDLFFTLDVCFGLFLQMNI